MTIEELQKQLEEANSKIKEQDDKIIKLNNENAERRVLNNELKKKFYVAEKIIDKNNIKVDISSLDKEKLTINKDTGQVEGDVTYNPVSTQSDVGKNVPPTSNSVPQTTITVDTIKGMSRTDIAKNWEAVQSAITNSADTANNNT